MRGNRARCLFWPTPIARFKWRRTTAHDAHPFLPFFSFRLFPRALFAKEKPREARARRKRTRLVGSSSIGAKPKLTALAPSSTTDRTLRTASRVASGKGAVLPPLARLSSSSSPISPAHTTMDLSSLIDPVSMFVSFTRPLSLFDAG